MAQPKLTILVGPPGSGKSTMAKELFHSSPNTLHTTYINQDSQGKAHMSRFLAAIAERRDIIVDRMNFDKRQRNRYLEPAKTNGYQTEIFIIHESSDTCMDRMMKRQDHETIRDRAAAEGALKFFFRSYERVEDSEADSVTRLWPKGTKFPAIVSDLDGTLYDVEHRRHFVRSGKKDWKSFFEGIKDDTLNEVVVDILKRFRDKGQVVYCSGRGMEYYHPTKTKLVKDGMWPMCNEHLYMRQESDFRSDDVVKEILLDFEILTRFKPYFILDDRDGVVAMWRKRGYTCLQVAPGDF